MLLWRISRFHDLSGLGARKVSARWNIAGPPMVYTSESPASALLEVCVHVVAGKVPETFQLLRISGPDLAVEEVKLDALPSDWIKDLSLTQSVGADWLNRGMSALLRVPSVLAPETWNVLLNPLHPDAASVRIEHHYDYPFDLRLKK